MKIIRKIITFITVVIIIFIIVGLFIHMLNRVSEKGKPFDTYLTMMYMAWACEDFKAANGKWPTSMPESFASRYGISTEKDEWDNDIVFVPYDGMLGYGEMISYGRDKKPGGSGLDRDWMIRFPLKQNFDWNKKQAVEAASLKGQNWEHNNWLDAHLLGPDQPTTDDSTNNNVTAK